MTLYPMPDLTVEISFDSPDAGSPTWVDVSDKVRATSASVTATRGRSDEHADGNQPGTLSLTLDNQDGAFTPGSDASMYWPNILPWRRVRVYLSTSYVVPIFYGFIQQWRQTWEAPDVPTVQIQALDSMALLGRRKLGATLDEHIAYDGADLIAHFPLDGTTSSTVGGYQLTGMHKSTAGEIHPGSDGGPVGGSGTAAVFEFTGTGYAPVYTCQPFTCDSYGAIESWFATDTVAAVPLVELVGDFGIPYYGPGVNVAVQVDGTLRAQIWSPSTPGTTVTADTTTTVNDGDLHALTIVWDTTTTYLYLDGILAATGAASPKRFHGATLRIGPSSTYMASPAVAGTVTIAHVSVYSDAAAAVFDATRAGVHALAGLGFAGESTFDRIDRWCDWIGVAATNTSATDEGEPLAPIPTAGRSVLECVADALRTDYGSILRASLTDREVAFTPRMARYLAEASITLDCADDQVDADLEVFIDPTYVASTTTVKAPSGDYTSTSAAALATYGELGMDVSMFSDTAIAAQSFADGLGLLAASPTPRLLTVTTDLLAMARDSVAYDPTAIPEVGALVDLVNLPDTAPAAQVSAFVEGVTERVSGQGWSRTCTLSPAYPWTSAWTVEDATRGEIEAGYLIAM